MIHTILSTKYNIILASKSPRRRQLLSEMGIEFELGNLPDVEEIYPDGLSNTEIVEHLARLKAQPYISEFNNDASLLIISSDTIVCIDNTILGKPHNKERAIDMLKTLSGKTHQVISGVSILSNNKSSLFSCTTNVSFKELSDSEIEFYVEKYKPYDKAGAYGIQDWIGLAAIANIDGSYTNVVGLPTQRLYAELEKYI